MESRPDAVKVFGEQNVHNSGMMGELNASLSAVSSLSIGVKPDPGVTDNSSVGLASAHIVNPLQLITYREDLTLAGILGFSLLFAGLCIKYRKEQILRLALFVLLVGVGWMNVTIAIKSQFNAHPDEAFHFSATSYYDKHWIKQRVDHPDMLKTLIPGWGVSYINGSDKMYFFYNKVGATLTPFFKEPFQAYRVLCVLIFLTLIALFFFAPTHARVFLLSICLAPQVWYVFSYHNAESFSLTIAILLCYFFCVYNKSIIEYYKGSRSLNFQVVGLIAFAAAVTFVRLNYLIVIPYLFLIIAVSVLPSVSRGAWSEFRPMMLRLIASLLVVFIPLGMDKLWDSWTNDFQREKLIADIMQKNQPEVYSKAFIIKGGPNPYLMYLRDSGKSLQDVFLSDGGAWFYGSIKSFYGMFGWLTFLCSPLIYRATVLVIITPIIVLLLLSFKQADFRRRLIISLSICVIGLIVIQSMMLTWLVAYQAQGRYMFALLPVLATALCLGGSRIVTSIWIPGWLFLVLLFNSYSYLRYALMPLLQ